MSGLIVALQEELPLRGNHTNNFCQGTINALGDKILSCKKAFNEATVKDAYPLPRIDDSLDSLGGAKYFSTLDLASGYWQVEMDDDARSKSAFITTSGLYEWNVLPFGLCNAPSTFEGLMDYVLAGLRWETLSVY